MKVNEIKKEIDIRVDFIKIEVEESGKKLKERFIEMKKETQK